MLATTQASSIKGPCDDLNQEYSEDTLQSLPKDNSMSKLLYSNPLPAPSLRRSFSMRVGPDGAQPL